MSVEVLRTYRFRCDAVQCSASVLSEAAEVPLDWSTVSSTAHQVHGVLPSVKSGRARLRALDLESMRSFGRFQLHLCPEHPSAFAEHQPRTDNPGGQGVVVSCSCGDQLGLTPRNAKATWLRHFHETSLAARAQGQTPPTEGDQVT